jgi:hypothetical protein
MPSQQMMPQSSNAPQYIRQVQPQPQGIPPGFSQGQPKFISQPQQRFQQPQPGQRSIVFYQEIFIILSKLSECSATRTTTISRHEPTAKPDQAK